MNYDILISMAADVARLKSDMDRASRAVEGGVADIRRHVAGINKVLGQIGVGLSVAGVATYFKNITVGAFQAADELGEVAEKAAVSAEWLSRTRLAAELSGTSFEGLATGLKMLNRSLVEAASGSKEQAEAFRQLGIDVRDSEGNVRNAADVFDALIAKMSEVEGSPEKVAAALKVLSKSGADLIPVLSMGREEFDRLRRMSDALGLSLDSGAIEKAGRVNDAFATLGKLSQGLGNRIMRELLPATEGIAASMLEAATNSGSFDAVARGIAVTFKILATGGSVVATVFKQLGTIIGGTAASLAMMLGGEFSNAFDTMKQTLSDVVRQGNESGQFIENLWKDQLPKLDTAAIKASDALRRLGTQNTEAAEEAKKLAAKVREVIDSFHEMTVIASNEADGAGKLTDAQRRYLSVLNDITAGRLKATPEQIKQIALAADEAIHAQKAADARKEQEKALASVSELYVREMEAQESALKTLDDAVKAQAEYNNKLGMSKDQLRQYAIAEREAELAVLERKRATIGLTQVEQEQVERLKELIRLMRDGALKEAAIESANTAREEWKRVAQDIERALTDALVRGFESGKSVTKSIGDWIANYFKTYVARSIAGALTGALGIGLSGVANAAGFGGAGGAGGGLGMLGSLGSLAGLGSLGSFGLTGLMSSLTGTGLGTSLGAAGSLISGGNIAGGIGMGLGSIAPYALAAYGIYRLISGAGTGRSRSPAVQNVGISNLAGQDLGLAWWAAHTPNGGVNADYVRAASGIAQQVDAYARLFGGASNPALAYGLYSSASPDGRGALVSARVQMGTSGAAPALFARNSQGANEDMMQRLMSFVPNMILAGLQQSALPARIKEYFSSVSADSITQEQLDTMLQVASAAHQMAEAFKDLGGPFLQLTDLTVEMRQSIADLTGGMDAFMQKVSGYYQQFYSPEEQQALSLLQAQRILESAGINTSGLTGRESFRSAVEGIDLSTEEGRRQFAAFMNAAGAFAGGSDLLAASGMSLAEFTAGAPTYAALEMMASQGGQTNDILTSIHSTLTDGFSMLADVIRTSMNVVVNTSGGSASEVGLWGGGGA